MAEEIQEAIQIIRVAYEGIEIAMKVGSGGLDAMKKTVDFLIGLLEYEKSIGKTSMRKLLERGGDLQVFQFQEEDLQKFRKQAKKYGILFAELPDVNKQDGKVEILFHSEAVPRVNILMQKLGFGKIAGFDEYLRSADGKDLERMMEFLKEQKTGNPLSHTEESIREDLAVDRLIEKVGRYALEQKKISVEALQETFKLERGQAGNLVKQLNTLGVLEKEEETDTYKVVMDNQTFDHRIKEYQELERRIRAVASSKDRNLLDITVSKTLIVKENETAVKTRIPGTWREDTRFLWIKKENIMELHSGKTMLTFLDRNKDYKIYDADNRVVGTMKGEVLYSSHYDKVDAVLREQVEKQKQVPGNVRSQAESVMKR